MEFNFTFSSWGEVDQFVRDLATGIGFSISHYPTTGKYVIRSL